MINFCYFGQSADVKASNFFKKDLTSENHLKNAVYVKENAKIVYFILFLFDCSYLKWEDFLQSFLFLPLLDLESCTDGIFRRKVP